MYLPKYLSYSSVNSYEECARSWYLAYARRGQKKQTWFLPMGTVVHESVEQYIATGKVPDFRALFDPLIEKQMRIDSNHKEWLSAGSGDDLVQGHKAVDLGKRCVENAVKFLEEFDVWEVEYEIMATLPGCEVPVRAFIDAIGEHKKYGPRIVDWKSGKTKPKTPLQLQTYKALLMVPLPNGSDHPFMEHGSLDINGWWGMLHPDAKPKTDKGRQVDLSDVDPAEIGARFQRAYEGMKKKVYAGQSKFACQFCFQQDNCKINAGETKRAKYYDLAETEGYPF